MIIEPAQLLIFMMAGIALNLTPGADMMFCLSQGLKSGRQAGFAASLGIATGSIVHVLLAAFGLAALIAANPVAFEVLRWAGVGYLVWLAVQALRHPVQFDLPDDARRSRPMRAWRDGVLVNLLNPKVIVFTLAFLPQFVDPERGSTVLQFLLLGLVLNITGTTVNGFVGIGAGSVRGLLAGNRWIARTLGYVSSAVFLGLAAKLAFDRR
ncbi:LysE family transporter [Anderseniella sp. Alg231-50]|uniref:LysE family transporter n=1 Tax=Anderseniella sp. Alg231-50 TaxID=1922226 RepID=UPI000D55F930